MSINERGSRDVYALGAISWIVVLTLLLSLIFVPMYFIKDYWHILADLESPWALPYLLGVLMSVTATKMARYLDDTTVGEWAIYAESYLETISYPKDPDHE